MRTNNGAPVEPRDMLRSKLKTVGIGLIDRVPGPYRLAIDRIWVGNSPFLVFSFLYFSFILFYFILFYFILNWARQMLNVYLGVGYG